MSSPSTPAGWAGAAPLRTGVGLRGVHHADWIASRPACGWLEAHAENYFAAGGPLPALLNDLHRDYPLSIHGVGLGLGGCDEPDRDHLAQLAALVRRHQPEVVSEHLCWGSHAGVHFNDLLPLPFNAETLARVCARVDALQSAIGRTVLIEHLASYVVFPESTVAEAIFLAELVRRTGCGLLLDLNNLHVNAVNHGFDALAFLDALPAPAIGEIHLAGHTPALIDGETVLIDTHGSAVCQAVWALYREALQRFGPIPTLIEWDTDVPRLEVLLAEAAHADVEAEAVAPGIAGSPATTRPDLRDLRDPSNRSA
jgi:uncharacterized protein (UPF0276 family)